MHDIALAYRRLRRTPLYAIFAVLSVSVGIGVPALAYSVVQALFWRPLGIPSPERIAVISAPGRGGSNRIESVMSWSDYQLLADAGISTLGSIVGSVPFFDAAKSGTSSEMIRAEAVSADYFEVLGVRPTVGRSLRHIDATTVAPVVIGYDLWQRVYSGRREILGQSFRVGERTCEVVGIAPKGFRGLRFNGNVDTEAWLLVENILSPRHPALGPASDSDHPSVTVVGRLREGASTGTAHAEISAIATRFDAVTPLAPSANATSDAAGVHTRKWSALPLKVAVTQGDAKTNRLAVVVLGLVVLVLIVACTNLANLTWAHVAQRQHEMAVRRALGASRWQLIRTCLAESSMLAVIGGIGAIALISTLAAWVTIDIPVSAARVIQLRPEVDTAIIALTALAVLLALCVFGLEPAVQLTRPSVRFELSDGTGTVARPRGHRQVMMLRWQIAASTTFFLIAAICAKIVVAGVRHESGIDVKTVTVATIDFRSQGWNETRTRALLPSVVDRLRRSGQFESIAISTGMPFGLPTTPFAAIAESGTAFLRNVQYPHALTITVTPSFFGTVGVRIVRGRGFDSRDEHGELTAIVSERTARTIFGTVDSVGRQLIFQKWRTMDGRGDDVCSARIVGVSADTDVGRIGSREDSVLYLAWRDVFQPNVVIVLRSNTVSSGAAAVIVRDVIRQTDPDVAPERIGPASMVLAPTYVISRIVAATALSLGALTLLLSMVGLYGAQSELVTARVREMGIRLALGATPGSLIRLVVAEGLRPVVQGVLIGLFFGVVSRVIVRALVVTDVAIIEPAVFAVGAVPLLTAGLAASYFPARSAALVDPNVALRHT